MSDVINIPGDFFSESEHTEVVEIFSLGNTAVGSFQNKQAKVNTLAYLMTDAFG